MLLNCHVRCTQFCERLNEKAEIKDGHLFRNHCWRELGLGMMANNPSVTCAERMAFSRHTNASSHLAYIRAGHNSDFAFQKAVSDAPMPKKKEILQQKSVATKVTKWQKQKSRKLSRGQGKRLLTKPWQFTRPHHQQSSLT